MDLYFDRITERDELLWNRERQRVERVVQLAYQGLVIDDHREPGVAQAALAHASGARVEHSVHVVDDVGVGRHLGLLARSTAVDLPQGSRLQQRRHQARLLGHAAVLGLAQDAGHPWVRREAQHAPPHRGERAAARGGAELPQQLLGRRHRGLRR